LSAGDDYELLLSIAPDMWSRLASFPEIKLTAIGKVTKTTALRLTESAKPWEHEGPAGYQHF
jgi:thiamine monophosphate kinase